MRLKLISSLAIAGTMAFMLTGCQNVTEVFDGIVDTSTISVSSESTGEIGTAVTEATGKTLDKSLKSPVFVEYTGGTIILPEGEAFTIDAEAESPDGGTVTYQWYTDNVNSNGGGTAIKGATDSEYKADTSEESVKYYYVVAKNEHDSSYMMCTSPVMEVKVIKAGEFVKDEFGGLRYLAKDGTYPSDMWVTIDGDVYLFTPEGYVATGWVDMGNGKIFYFDEQGKLLKDTITPDGYQVDENGVRVGDTPVVEQPAAEQPAEEQPVEEQPAEEQPVEEQPAEEQPVE